MTFHRSQAVPGLPVIFDVGAYISIDGDRVWAGAFLNSIATLVPPDANVQQTIRSQTAETIPWRSLGKRVPGAIAHAGLVLNSALVFAVTKHPWVQVPAGRR